MTHVNQTIYDTATIENCGENENLTLRLELRLDADDAYRWYNAESGEDQELSGNSIKQARETLFSFHGSDYVEGRG